MSNQHFNRKGPYTATIEPTMADTILPLAVETGLGNSSYGHRSRRHRGATCELKRAHKFNNSIAGGHRQGTRLHTQHYGYGYTNRNDHGDPRMATVRADDPLDHHGTRYKKQQENFSCPRTPVLKPTRQYCSRDRKKFLTAQRVQPVLKRVKISQKLPFAIARLTRAQIFFANCFFSTRFQY